MSEELHAYIAISNYVRLNVHIDVYNTAYNIGTFYP